MKFIRRQILVEAVAMSGTDFILQSPAHFIRGKRDSNPTPGFKFPMPDGWMNWLPASQFEMEFVRVADDYESPARPDFAVVERLIASGLRSLASTAHPDHGGSDDQMAAVN